jgi:hypothetical protein
MLRRPIGRVFAGDREATDTDTLTSLGCPAEVIARPPPTEFVFGDDRHSVEVDDDVPFSEILGTVLLHFSGVAVGDVIGVCGSGIEIGAEATLASVGRPELVELKRKPSSGTVFEFEGRAFRPEVAPDAPLSSVLEIIGPEIGIEPSNLFIESGGSEADPSMTLEDLDFPPVLRVLRKLSLSDMIASVVSVFGEDASEPTGADVAPTDVGFKVLCSVVGFPQIHTVFAPPLSTLADAEPAIKAQCGVGERETVFEAVDESGATRRVDPARLVREFAGTGFMLVLRSRGLPEGWMTKKRNGK